MMREKMIVRKFDSHDGRRKVFGIRYDEEESELMIGGAWGMRKHMKDFIYKVFGPNTSRIKKCGQKVRYFIYVDLKTWINSDLTCNGEYTIQEVTTFRRMMF